MYLYPLSHYQSAYDLMATQGLGHTVNIASNSSPKNDQQVKKGA